MAHIDLSRGVDAILIAPAIADFIAKLAHGLADDLLSTLCLARECPLLVAPAMNRADVDEPRHPAQRRAAARPTASASSARAAATRRAARWATDACWSRLETGRGADRVFLPTR